MRTPFTYTQIYNNIEKASSYWKNISAKEKTNQSYIDKWLCQVPFLEEQSRRSHMFIFLYDTNAQRFIYVLDEKQILGGYDLILYTAENGVEFSFSRLHPLFLNSMLALQKIALSHMFSSECSTQDFEPIASMDTLYRKKDENYFHLLQQSVTVERDAEGMPALILSYGHDITPLKKEGTANLVINNRHDIKIWNYNFDKEQTEEVKPISPQERKVLELLNQGRDTKKIAAELFISPLTVDTHRRNLLKKTNCVDTTALITYAKIVGIL
ncbi:MAG TPA: helix-turn-helix transcriptional regulator [Segetibacter sp.]|jgi:DNA-binding CsgD family transcriptional regulator